MRRLLIALLLATPLTAAKRPAITVVCVVDQMAEHLVSRHRPFLRGGINHFFEHGRSYSNAYHPHGLPATATGHTALSTGAHAEKHGIIANEWLTPDGKQVKACDDDNPKHSAVFSPTGLYDKGKSANSLLAPTLSCNAILDDAPFTSISLSLKSRAAIPCAGKLGTAIWFDSKAGQFTSSIAFGSRLPSWVVAMNRHLKQTLHKQKTTQWSAQYPEDHEAYNLVCSEPDNWSGYPFSLVDSPQPIHNGRSPYFLFQQTPQANQELLRMAQLAIAMQRRQHPGRPILLWLSLSSLDYVGHYYGPYSKEMVDMVFHLDNQLGHFIKKLEEKYGTTNCLWALTADHGVLPIPERLKQSQQPTAQRLDSTPIIKDLNRAIYKSFNTKNLIKQVNACNLYLNHTKWDHIAPTKQSKIITFIKQYLAAIEGIANVWHSSDFKRPAFDKKHGIYSRERWFKLQYFASRSGDFIIQTKPYTYLTAYQQGTSHESPYDYDVRVPLVLYGPTRIKPGVIDTRVPVTHLPTTLAYLLDLPRPANAPPLRLPGI